MKKQVSLWPVVLMAFLGGVAVWWMTSVNGPGINGDAVRYLQAAKAMAMGQGPLVHNNAGLLAPMGFPSAFYAAILSTGWFAGMSLQEWGRWLGIIFFSVNILLAGVVVLRVFRDMLAAVTGAALVLCFPFSLLMHGWIGPAPLVLTLALLLSLVVVSIAGSPVIPALSPVLRRKVSVAAGLVIVIGAVLSLRDGILFYQEGAGYTAQALASSKFAETLRSLDDNVPLYADDPLAVYHFTGRPAVKIPVGNEAASLLPALPVAVRDFRVLRAVAVVVHRNAFQPAPAWKALTDLAQIELLMKGDAGDIYGVRRK